MKHEIWVFTIKAFVVIVLIVIAMLALNLLTHLNVIDLDFQPRRLRS